MRRGIKCYKCDWPYVPIGETCPNCGAKDIPLTGKSLLDFIKALVGLAIFFAAFFFLFLFLLAKCDKSLSEQEKIKKEQKLKQRVNEAKK